MKLPKIDIKVYADVIKTRAAWAFDIGTMMMRLLQFMFTLGTVSMMTLSGYSALIAGTVASTISIALFFIGPRISKKIDECGQHKIVPFAVSVCFIGLIGLICSVSFAWPIWCCYLFAVLVGFYPNAGAMARTRWAYLIRTNKFGAEKISIRTAYAYEGILEDIAFMFGPAISIALNAAIHPAAGMLIGAFLLAGGAIILCASKNTEPEVGWKTQDNPATPDTDEAENEKKFYEADSAWVKYPNRSVILLSRTVLIMFLAYVMVGLTFGSFDSTVVVFCESLGMPTYASFIMSYSGVISAFAGFFFGMMMFKTPLSKMLVITGVLYGATYFTTSLSFDALSLLFFITVASGFYAPFLLTSNNAVERAVPGYRLTEGITWMNTGTTIGFAVGPTAAGALIDAFGATAGFIPTACGTLSLVILMLVARKTLKRELA